MNSPNTSMNQPELANKELITQVLQEVLAEQPTWLTSLATSACQCHWIDPHKLRMLLWKDKDTYILKIAEQKFVGESRLDRRGEVYWKFRELYEDQETKSTEVLQLEKSSATKPPAQLEIEINQPLSNSSGQTDRLAKFQERQAKAQQLQSQKETKWIPGAEFAAQLEKEKAARKAQLASEQIQENAN